MKTSLALLAALLSFSVFSADEIIKETWNCKNENVTFTAVLTPKTAKVKLTTVYSVDAVALNLAQGQTSLQNGLTTEFTGSILEHDTFDFKATVVRTNEDDFSDFGEKRSTAKGKLILITDMFIDCVGNSAAVDLVECTVAIERK